MKNTTCWFVRGLPLLALAAPLAAHGGRFPPPPAPPVIVPPPPRYQGPADAPGPRGPTNAGRPGGPGSAGPGTPGAWGPTAAAPMPASAANTPRGALVEPDPITWSLWWAYHRHDYLRVRGMVRSEGVTSGSDDFYLGGAQRADSVTRVDPTKAALEREVVPRLLAELRTSSSRPIILTTMLALAKMDITDEATRLLPLLRQKLRADQQQVRETAALCLGVCQDPSAMIALTELLLDTEAGRKLVARERVDDRTRAFAAYGLGCMGAGAPEPATGKLCAMALEQALRKAQAEDRDVLVAAITGLRLLDRVADKDLVAKPLLHYYGLQLGASDDIVQAHVPTALAAVLGRGGDRDGKFIDQLRRDLHDDKRSPVIRQSAAIALGELCDASPREWRASETLWAYVADGKDQQARAFALVALGRIGGDRNRTALLQRLATSTTIERPWVALALGLLAHAERPLGVDHTAARALAQAMTTTKNDEVIGAAAVAIGLSGCTELAPELRALLEHYRQRSDLAAHLCTGLGLLNDRGAVPTLRSVLSDSRRRSSLLTDAATALVRIGDHDVGAELAELLREPSREFTTLGTVASALGTVGDRRCIAPLLEVFGNREVPDLGRAYAAVALGEIGDPNSQTLVHRLTHAINYRALLPTLSDQSTGVLDIL